MTVAHRLTTRLASAAYLIALLAASSPGHAVTLPELERDFANPPATARPHTWWHWMNGNISKDGITADLQAMKEIGLGGAQILDVTDGILPGPVPYMSARWRTMVKHAVAEASSRGLELCIHNCAGWSSSGGPWVTPAQAMQMVVTSEAQVRGPAHFAAALPQPPTRREYYRDIAVLAFPTPPDEASPIPGERPTLTATVPGFDAARATDGDPNSASTLSLRSAGKQAYVQFGFPRPTTIRALSLIALSHETGMRAELLASADGATFASVASLALPESEVTRPPTTISFPPVSGRCFRVAFTRSGSRVSNVALAEIKLERGFRLNGWAAKAGYVRGGAGEPDRQQVPATSAVPHAQIVDLTGHLAASGRLEWDVPAGDWTILRFGHTPTGKDNHPAPEPGRGLECDKLSKAAVGAHFTAMLEQVIGDCRPQVGRTLKHVLIDSYEVGCQNWTPRLREEFARRRGYDPLPYLPAMAGRVVDSVEVSERFLWDLRRTLADLFADNYYGYFATLCHRYGLLLSVEPYGNGNFDDLQCGGRADIPMGEFWVGEGGDSASAKLAASAAHTWGRTVVGAESFTADAPQGKWLAHPYSLKALGDRVYCGGVNRFIFHRYAHQPWAGLLPGMTMGPHGTHFERTLTWWSPGAAWIQYLSRCQLMLQAGRFAADLCYFTGEDAPAGLPGRGGLNPPPPAGYDYDGCSTEVILSRMAVRRGRLILPDGMGYRVLVLPPGRTMTPAVLAKVRELIRAGAIVVGPKPTRAPGLTDYPACDARVAALADEVWGPCDGKTVTEHAVGKGTLIWGKPLAEVLARCGAEPDYELRGMRTNSSLRAIHRSVGSAEVYFIANQRQRAESIECSFRVSGRRPEVWHPDTGAIERPAVYRVADGRTILPLWLGPCGSAFVVFREPAPRADPVVSLQRNGRSVFEPTPLPPGKLEVRKAVYGVLAVEQPDVADVTAVLARLLRNGTLTVKADNTLAGDPAPNVVKQLQVDYTLDGQSLSKTIEENQTLKLPEDGRSGRALTIRRARYGIIPLEAPEPPQERWRDVTDKLAGMVHDGALSVVAGNALAGDPAPMVVKELRVDYVLNGKSATRTIRENQVLDIPDGMEQGGGEAAAPEPTLVVARDGRLTLTAWTAGVYKLTTAAGRRMTRRVSGVPPPHAVTGPWRIAFPPHRGAPVRATFAELISWTESDDPGIKFFSGTATYSQTVDIPRPLLARGNVLLLDLGQVREMARVRLNGKDLGVLWKPPFRVEVTGVARAGENHLEVEVTNLWPNRLIGDEQYPDDCEWAPGGPLKAWPQWLVQGKRRPPTPRVTFTTWKHFTQDSPLIESGLLGPVVLRVGKVVHSGGAVVANR